MLRIRGNHHEVKCVFSLCLSSVIKNVFVFILRTHSAAVLAQEETVFLPMEFVVYLPWLRVIVLNSVSEQGRQEEVLSLSFQDVLVERYSEVKHVKLRALGNE